MKRGPKAGYKQTAEHIAARIVCGELHHKWAGAKISEKGGRARALRWYPEIGPCIKCGSFRSERHHKDGDTSNNVESNIESLCRKCHMVGDGRLDALKKQAKKAIKKANAGAAEKRRTQTECKRGHPLSGDNLRVSACGKRICKECNRIAVRKYLLKKDKS